MFRRGRVLLRLLRGVTVGMVLAACSAPAETAEPTTMPAADEPEESSMIDRVAAAILAQDVEGTRALIHFTTAGCTNTDGLGGPPKCEEGQAEGTPVDFLPILGPGEGSLLLAENVETILPLAVSELVGVYQMPAAANQDPIYPAGDFGLVFAGTDGFLKTVTVRVTDAGMVRIDYSPASPEEVLTNSGGTVIEQ